MKSRKLRSFTLVELTIALLLSSITIGLVYSAIVFFNTRFERSRERTAETSEHFMLVNTMKKDFDESYKIFDSLPGIVVMSQVHRTIYYYLDTIVTRMVDGLEHNFSVKVNDFALTPIEPSSNIIKKMSIGILVREKVINHIFSKSYSSEQLIHFEKNTR